VLEVANVLSHYFAVDHDILDKFESGGSVRTEDVVSFRTADRYDLIVSISTLEHVGWDEEPQDAGKISRAIANLSDHLAPGGRLLATLPPAVAGSTYGERWPALAAWSSPSSSAEGTPEAILKSDFDGSVSL
jgi:hypothetical protein